MKKLLTAIFAIGALGTPAVIADTASPDAGTGNAALVDNTAPDGRAVMDLLYAGEGDSALAILDAPPFRGSRDPSVMVLRARIMREMFVDEDYDKALISADAEPLMALLEETIDICDRALDQPQHDPKYYYYRGFSHLWKAQIYTITRRFWAAGRSAKSAKNDLTKYLEQVPDDPDAQGALGAFYYFADAIPGVAKLVSKLLLFPTGDRTKGLGMMYYGATNDGVFTTDYQIALAAGLIIFEGRIEEASAALSELADRYPNYARLSEPMGVLAPLHPFKIRELQRLEDAIIERHTTSNTEPDRSLVQRVYLHRLFSTTYFGDPAAALSGLDHLNEAPGSRPDWLHPMARLLRGTLLSLSGRGLEARGDFVSVRDHCEISRFKDVAKKLLEDLEESDREEIDLDDLAFVEALYDGDRITATAGLIAFREKYGENVLFHFYQAELLLFEQRFRDAASSYEEALKTEAQQCQQGYQMFACLRLAEIHGHEMRFEKAEELIDHAMGYTHVAYLFEYTMRSRQRYYKMLNDGKIRELPSSIIAGIPDAEPASHSAR